MLHGKNSKKSNTVSSKVSKIKSEIKQINNTSKHNVFKSQPKSSNVHKRTISMFSTLPKTEKNNNNLDLSNHDIKNEELNEVFVFERLKESLKIFEKIQKNFELSDLANKKREVEIKNILRNIIIDDYPYISDFEKRIISDQIVESSEQRIKNYQNLFKIINTTLIDIKDCFLNYCTIEPINKNNIISRNSKSENKVTKYPDNLFSNSFSLIDDFEDESNDDLCNFSEAMMLETKANRENEFKTQFPRKKTKKTKLQIHDVNRERFDSNDIIDDNINDSTLIEYNNISLQEENPIFIKAKDDVFKRINTDIDDNTISVMSQIFNKNSIEFSTKDFSTEPNVSVSQEKRCLIF